MRHELARVLVRHFAEAAGVPRRIRVFTRAGAFERHMAHRGGLTDDEKEHLRSGFAISVYRERTPHEIYFNFSRHVSPADLLDTAAHEITHLRWNELDHGRLFDRRKTALLAGYRCGPKSEPMPDPFR